MQAAMVSAIASEEYNGWFDALFIMWIICTLLALALALRITSIAGPGKSCSNIIYYTWAILFNAVVLTAPLVR